MKLYVGNLTPTMTETELRSLCDAYGEVKTVTIIHDHYTRQSKCFGYVMMAGRIEGDKVIQGLHGRKIRENLLVVKEARSRDERRGQPW